MQVRRWSFGAGVAATCLALACAPPSQRKPIEWEPIGTVPADKLKAPDEPVESSQDSAGSGSTSGRESESGNTKIESAGDCKSDKFDDLMGALANGACEAEARAERPADLRDSLEVRMTPSAASVSPSGHVDLQIAYRNKGSKPITLLFALDPGAKFEPEVFDSKGRLVGASSAKGAKKGAKTSSKVAKLVLGAGGTGKAKVSWTAPQTKGKYTVRVLTSLLVSADTRDKDLSAPRTQVQVD